MSEAGGATRPGANSSPSPVPPRAKSEAAPSSASESTLPAGGTSTPWVGSAEAVPGTLPAGSAVREPVACPIAAVPATGERPMTKITKAAAAQTSAAATRWGLWSGLVRTKRMVRLVVLRQERGAVSPWSDVSPSTSGAERGRNLGRGKGTVGLAGRRNPSSEASAASTASLTLPTSIGLHGAPSMALAAARLGAAGLRDAGGVIPTRVLRERLEAKSRSGEGKGANVLLGAGCPVVLGDAAAAACSARSTEASVRPMPADVVDAAEGA